MRSTETEEEKVRKMLHAATPMLSAEGACDLLDTETLPTAFSLEMEGAARYPLFQFDAENSRVFPVVQDILAELPEHWSQLSLLYWFMQEHYDFDGPPAAALGSNPDGVMSAFRRVAPRPTHG